MWTRIGLLIASLFILNACSDDTAGGTSTSDAGTETGGACTDEDGDGFSVGVDCTLYLDCDDTNAEVFPGHTETCYDGLDNDCDGAIDEGCPQCDEGATKACGKSVGTCVEGTQRCEDGDWTICEGEVRPTTERCDGLDNDCDGDVDEGAEVICDDGIKCNGAETCVAGMCESGEVVDCTTLNGPCQVGVCKEKDGQCSVTNIDDGTTCDDGLFCTLEGACLLGECIAPALDCSGEGDQCNAGVCDEANDKCVKSPVSDGTTCDDNAFCTTAEVCTQGTCGGGAARDCAASGDQCNTGVCDETLDACLGAPKTNGTACDDGAYCTTGESCQTGACMGGSPRQCSAQGGSCRTGTCDETLDACTGDPVPDGTTCDDGAYCTIADSCAAGTCLGSSPRDCSASGNQCNLGICNETNNACQPAPKPNGTVCTDGLFCTSSDTCQAGACSGTPRDCSGAADVCNTGTCNESVDACVPVPKSDGTSCNDNLFCTVNDICGAGTCGSLPRDCSGQSDACNAGACNETADRCDAVARPNGTACNDGAFCTVGDACAAGTCTGGARDCSGSGTQCTTGVCDETFNTCTSSAKADGTVCNDSQYCTVSDACGAGTCSGAARSCAAVADQCNNGICNESTDACVKSAKANGTTCNDAQFCTISDTCSAGSCGGLARDCSGVGDQCNTGICNEVSDACQPQGRPNGTACDDSQFCTVSDACFSGACLGGPGRDCSGATGGNICLIASCNEGTNMCTTANNPVCCNVNKDADLDGVNECNDCDDSDASIRPGAIERCNGVDDDCDGAIDEDFDQDMDGFTLCSTDPAIFDCNDTNGAINPGAAENCGPSNTGNGLDDDCDGYIDEGCNPCTTTDVDGDGWSECDGDCADNDNTRYPGAPEQCDGKDNDCNIYTKPNCGVSDTCNQDLDGNFANDPDLCQPDQICACLIQGRSCSGNWRCTSFCNSSATGPLGDGCQADQTCGLDLLYSANIHGCNVNTDPPGTKLGGVACSQDNECRSLQCDKPCVGPGCNQKYCTDLCTADDRCGAGAVCRVFRTPATTSAGGNMDGRCYPVSLIGGTTTVGNACTSDSSCNHAICTTDPNTAAKYCSQSCCDDSDCSGGYTCSYSGSAEEARVAFSPPGAKACTADSQCVGDGGFCFNNKCSWRITETTGQCIKDVAAQGVRVAGQACVTNSQCRSNFCEKDLGICVEPCCADSGCPNGLECEKQFVQTTSDRATQGRVCINTSIDGVLRRK